MVNSVSFGSANAVYTPKKKSTKTGTAIGAGIGFAYSAANAIKNKGQIPALIQEAVTNGMTKNKATACIVGGLVLGAALYTCLGALIGKGVNAVVNHFKKDKVDPMQVKV